MKLLHHIEGNSGIEYRIYLKLSVTASKSYFIKWRKYLFGFIPYFAWVKTQPHEISPDKVQFDTVEKAVAFIVGIEKDYLYIDSNGTELLTPTASK